MRAPPNGRAGDLSSSVRRRTRAGGCRFRMGALRRVHDLYLHKPRAGPARDPRWREGLVLSVRGGSPILNRQPLAPGNGITDELRSPAIP